MILIIIIILNRGILNLSYYMEIRNGEIGNEF